MTDPALPKIAFVNDRILAYATGDPAASGGAERQQWLLARALAAEGWPVVVGHRKGMPAGARERIEGVDYVGLGEGSLLQGWQRFLASENPAWWYWRCASHLWGPAVVLSRRTRVKTIFAAGFDQDVHPSQALVGRRHLLWPLYAWGLGHSDRIFVQHTGQFNGLRPRLRSRALVVRSIALPSQAGPPHAHRESYVAWVAMLRQAKRPDLLLELARAAPQVRFVVCGRPSSHRTPAGYGERIAQLLHEMPNVDYRGQVAPQEAAAVIANASVLLSTSDEEGFPNTFLQAWSSGTPVVTLRVDPDGIVAQNGLGAVAPNLPEAAQQISVLLASPSQRDAIAARARRYVADAHGAPSVVRVVERAIRTNPAGNGALR